jgi:NAD(P)H-dependent flavin oxidoreductase YrpB (nitropropane dioxygenase family)
VRAVRVPVIAAGGIADAAGVAAALALGAAGVQVGTAYLLCPEATTSLHRAALQSPDAGHTALTNVFTGRPARGIVNRFMRELGRHERGRAGFPAGHRPRWRRCARGASSKAWVIFLLCGQARMPAAAGRWTPPK